MEHNPTIAVIGGTFWGNRGAESMLSTTIGLLRRDWPGAHFLVFSYYPKKDRELVQDENITIFSSTPFSLLTRHFIGALVGAFLRFLHINIPTWRFFKPARMLLKSDILLDIGGITFSDGREKYLPFNILSIWPAMVLGIPVVKMAQAIGPFNNRLNRLCANIFLHRCHWIFARGEKSYMYLKYLKFSPKKITESADIVFLYENEFSLTCENESLVGGLVKKLKKLRKTGKLVIVLSPSVLVESQSRRKGKDYISGFLDAIQTLSENVEYHFVVIPNATRAGSSKIHNNDLITVNRMKNRFEEELVHKVDVDWVDYDINTWGVRQVIEQANVLVTSRYHAMISGLCMFVPTLVIGWSHKYRETMAYFGLEEFALGFEDNEINVTAYITSILESEVKIRRKISGSLPHVKRKSQLQFDLLKQVIQ